MPCLSNQGYVSIILFKKQGPALAYHPFFFANRSGFCLRAFHGVKIRQRSRKIRVKSVWFVGYPLQSEKRYGILLGNRSHGSRKFMKKKAELIPLLWTLTVPVSVCLRPSSFWWLFPPISPCLSLLHLQVHGCTPELPEGSELLSQITISRPLLCLRLPGNRWSY